MAASLIGEISRTTARNWITGGRFVWVEGAGHDIDLTQPERVREVLDEIWNEATAHTD